jgi:hypothetical protein
MLHWDGEMRKARVAARMKALSPLARTSFGAGSLFHAYEEVRGTAEWGKSGEALVKILDRAFKAVWDGVGRSSAHAFGGADLKDDLKRHAPGEDDPSLPGQADLVDGVLRLLNLRRDPKPAGVLDMASFAYQAITEIAFPTVSGGEETFRQAERSSPACLKEIEFQLAYLAALEVIGGGDVRWASVVARCG